MLWIPSFCASNSKPTAFLWVYKQFKFQQFCVSQYCFYLKVVRNSAKKNDGQTSKVLEFELVWLLTPLLLDTASEVTISMASEQVFSKTDNYKNIRDTKVTLPLYIHL